jgi:hypothetical protein
MHVGGVMQKAALGHEDIGGKALLRQWGGDELPMPSGREGGRLRNRTISPAPAGNTTLVILSVVRHYTD